MQNTHIVSWDWGSCEIWTDCTLSELLALMSTGQSYIFQRYIKNKASEIIINMKLVSCIYPLEQ